MKVKSFGCSFIFGCELADDGRDGPYATPSKFTWPALVAKNLNYQYECYARPGAGNLRIAEQVLNQAALGDNDLFVIGWTWIDRFDYTNPTDDTWATIMPIDETVQAKFYYKDLHSQYRDKLSTLLNMRVAIDTLQQQNIPFIMTYMDELIFETKWHTSPAVIALQNHIRPHMTQFEGKSFLDWSRSYNYPISDMWHPLEAAHKAAADYILNASGVLQSTK
jgi:hypothetical protein